MYRTLFISGLVVLGTVVAGGCRDEPLPGRSLAGVSAQSGSSHGTSISVGHRILGPVPQPLWGQPSPDGRLWVFIDDRGVVIRDLATGEEQVTVAREPGAMRWADNPRFSPDGSALEFLDVSLSLASGTSKVERSVAISARPVAGGETLVLMRPTARDLRNVELVDWSWSGGVAVGIRRSDANTHRLVMFNREGARDLKSFDWRAPENLALSSDGRFLAYDVQPDETSPHHDVMVIATDASRETVIAAHSADDRVVGWAPDGRLVIASDRFGTMGFFAVTVTDGRQRGEPELIASDLHRFTGGMAVSRQGTIYYQVQPTGRDVYAFTIDPATMHVIDSPARVSASSEGENDYPTWSRDGRTLAYVSYGRTRRVGARIVLQSLETGQVREVRPDMAYVQAITLLPDGGALLARGQDARSREGVFEVQIPSGTVRPVLLAGEWPGLRLPGVSADGRTFYFVSTPTLREGPAGPRRLMAMNRATGEMSQLRELNPGENVDQVTMPAPSSADSRLAFANRTSDGRWHISVFPRGGGSARMVYTAPAGQAIAPASLNWMDDRRLMFMTRDAESQQVVLGTVQARDDRNTERIWRLDVEDGTLVESNFRWREFVAAPVLHPNGRRIVFQSGLPSYEVWALEHALTSGAR